MKTVTILGATGSVGQQTLDVLRSYTGDFDVVALTARSASDVLVSLCAEFNPVYAVVESEAVSELEQKFKHRQLETAVLSAQDQQAMSPVFEVDITVTAVTGAAGLRSTLQAVRTGNTVLVVNKEPVVMLGPILHQEVRQHGTTILPVDSEHNAIFQCSASATGSRYEPFFPIPGLRRILLAGTGGPFLKASLDSLKDITPEQAVAHPIWNMGAKISVDSATMMNKGLEIIEARWLFDTSASQIDVVVHRQGIVHSMVEFLDGSIIAQMATPDMRIPIANAMFWPERKRSGAEYLDLFNIKGLTFEPPDFERFPCLKLAQEVSMAGGTSATVMNAANEVAVNAFLSSRIRFTQISSIVHHSVDTLGDERVENIEQIVEIDTIARKIASKLLN